MLKKSFAFLLGMVLLLGCAAKSKGQEEDDASPVPEPEPEAQNLTPEELDIEIPDEVPIFKELIEGDFHLSWLAEGDYLHVRLSAPTTGWVALGIAPSSMMKDANIIMGYVSEGKVEIYDEFGDGNTSHKPDVDLGGTNNVSEKSGWEKEGVTQISFMIPLNSGDEYDKVLEPGGTYKIILAYGTKDDVSSFHKKKTSAVIEDL